MANKDQLAAEQFVKRLAKSQRGSGRTPSETRAEAADGMKDPSLPPAPKPGHAGGGCCTARSRRYEMGRNGPLWLGKTLLASS
jgi:hypothetical protein